MDGKQLHGGDSELGEMLDGHGVGQTGVGSPELGRDSRVEGGEALDVHLVDHGLVHGRVRVAVVTPVEPRVHHHGLGHEGGAVDVIGLEDAFVPAGLPRHRLGVGVEEKLGRVAAVASLGPVRPVNAEPVALARSHTRHIAVPTESRDVGKVDPGLLALLPEQAQLHSGGHLGEEGEVGAGAVVCGPEWVWLARQDPQGGQDISRPPGHTVVMADDPAVTEKRAKSVALPTEDGGEQVVAQQNAGPEAESGSGEWPSPGAAPSGPAPGTTPEGAEAASRREQAPPQHPSPQATGSQADQQQDATAEGDRGPARTDAARHSISQALNDEPVAGGSSSVPDGDDPVETSPG